MKMEKKNKDTKIYAVWFGCGGKNTYPEITDETDAIYVGYDEMADLSSDKDYIEDITKYIGKHDYIITNTMHKGLKLLTDNGFEVNLVYPDITLKYEYLERYIDTHERDYDIGNHMRIWEDWINGLKEEKNCKHIVLQSGQYLQDILPQRNTKICSVFYGCIKDYKDSIEISYWASVQTYKEYIDIIKDNIGKYEYIFISDTPDTIKALTDYGLTVTLVYPDQSLKYEYLERYIENNEDVAVIGYYMVEWDTYMDMFKIQDNCNHVVLQSGEYLEDVL